MCKVSFLTKKYCFTYFSYYLIASTQRYLCCFHKEAYDEVLCNKSSSTEKNNEALNGKDLMIERKEQGRKVNKKTHQKWKKF